jgi:hypothetical protein
MMILFRDYCCLSILDGHQGSIKCLTAVVEHCDDNFESEEPSFLLLEFALLTSFSKPIKLK